MSFVIAAPDLVENAAGDLAAIRSSLAEATAAAATPTTGLLSAAQDEVSIAIASMFGGYGEQFQALTAQASAFHAEFVSVLNAGAGAYLTSEVENAAQTVLGGGLGNLSSAASISGGVGQLSGEIQAGLQGISGALSGELSLLQAGGATGLVSGLGTFGTNVLAPYEAVVTNTVANLQNLGGVFTSNPFPFLNQLASNQLYYGEAIATAVGNGIQNLPTIIANLPATIQADLQAILSFNPGTYIQGFVNNQIGYAQTILTGLQNAGTDLVTGIQQLPAGFETVFQDLLAGNNIGAYTALQQTLQNAFFPGFQDISFDLSLLGSPTASPIPIVPMGVLGDVGPILAIPGEVAQNLAALLPAGSIPGLMAHNAANLFTALTNFGQTFSPTNLGINLGLPLQLIVDGIGAPANALSSLNSSAVALTTALQGGDWAGAATAFLDTPANALNAFINGQTYITLPTLNVAVTSGGIPLLSLGSAAEIPLGGLLTPLSAITSASTGALPGTETGGILPAFLNYGEQLAQAIALPAPVYALPPFLPGVPPFVF